MATKLLVISSIALGILGCTTTKPMVPRAAPEIPLATQPEKCRNFPSPWYPDAAEAVRQEGWVHIEYGVTASDRVVNATIVDSSPQGVFEAAVLKAIELSNEGKPEADAIPVVSGCQLAVRFRLVEPQLKYASDLAKYEESQKNWRPTFRAQPFYPRQEMERGRVGCVMVGRYVGSDGRVMDIEVIKQWPKSTHFAKAAIKAVAQFHFEPINANRSPSWDAHTITFGIDGIKPAGEDLSAKCAI